MSRKRHVIVIPVAIIILIGLLAGYAYYVYQRPLPDIEPATATAQLQGGAQTSNNLTWPSSGQSAVAVADTDILETHGKQVTAPTASVAKVISALVILQKKPLMPGQEGTTIELGAGDVTLYNNYVALEGSVVPVSDGEQISEHQMLEAMMLPSANNIADSLAIWAYGSLPDYQAAAKQYVQKLGLHDTVIGSDASGFSASTTSSAHDLVIIGEQAMANPVLRQIVALPSANDVPQASTIKNVNFLLGTANIIGIKTGNTDEAGGVFLSASTTQVNGRAITIVTALLGAPTLFTALQQSLPLVTTAQINFAKANILNQQSIVGRYNQPWGGSLAAVAQHNLTAETWRGSTVAATAKLKPISATVQAGQIVGNVTTQPTPFADAAQTNIVLQQAPTKPSIWWRLLHPKS